MLLQDHVIAALGWPDNLLVKIAVGGALTGLLVLILQRLFPVRG